VAFSDHPVARTEVEVTMRILVFNWRDGAHPEAGGAEVYTEEVLARWAADGHSVTLFSAAVAGAPADERSNGIRRIRRGGRLGVYREAKRWYRRQPPRSFDLVIDETNTRPFFCHEWVGAAPVVALFHQTCEEIWQHQMPFPVAVAGRHFFEPSWLRRMQGVPALAVSASTRDALGRFGVDDVVVVPEGLTLPDAPSVPKADVPTLIHVGRLVSYKQVDHIIEAVGIAREHMPELRLWVVGGGPELAALRAEAPSGVEFFGFVPHQEKLERMSAAHAIVMASTREGWGLVVAEAAALGTRAIAYDRPGVRDAVTAAQGVLVPPTPEALAAWICATLPDWVAEPPAPVAGGGVSDWDIVAERVLESALDQAGIDPAAASTDPYGTERHRVA
jgi:glycosyltransferase involved in cell wall biosynthesis